MEGKFAEAKRKYVLGHIRACLAKTRETVILLVIHLGQVAGFCLVNETAV